MKIRADEWYFYLLCFFAFSLPFAGFHIPKYVLGILIILKIFIILKDLNGFKSLIIKKRGVLIFLLLCPVYFGITLLYSADTANGLNLLGRYSFCFIMPFIFLVKNESKVLYSTLLSYVLGSISLIALNFLLVIINWDDSVFYSYSKFYYQNLSSFVALHPGYYSLIIASAMFIVLIYVKSKIKILVVSLFAATLFLLSSKGIIILSLLGLVVWFCDILKNFNKLSNISGWIISAVLISFLFSQTHIYKRMKQGYKSFENVTSVYDDPNNRLDENLLRLFLFKYSIDTINKNNSSILFGYGIGDYQEELLETYSKEKYGYGLHYEYNSHNQYLTTTLMSGLIGLILFVMYLLTPIIFGNNKNKLVLLVLLLLFGFAFLESYFSREIGILISTFLITTLSMFTFNHPKVLLECNN